MTELIVVQILENHHPWMKNQLHKYTIHTSPQLDGSTQICPCLNPFLYFHQEHINIDGLPLKQQVCSILYWYRMWCWLSWHLCNNYQVKDLISLGIQDDNCGWLSSGFRFKLCLPWSLTVIDILFVPNLFYARWSAYWTLSSFDCFAVVGSHHPGQLYIQFNLIMLTKL